MILKNEENKLIVFLRELCLESVIDFPIDFEFVEHDDKELAEIFGYWFGGENWSLSGDKFTQIGQDNSGSLYLLWEYPELKEDKPVVLLSSDGDAYLISNNLCEFIKQMSSGKLFYNGSWIESDEKFDWEKLRSIVTKELGEISDPNKATEDAQLKHPNFKKWVESNIQY